MWWGFGNGWEWWGGVTDVTGFGLDRVGEVCYGMGTEGNRKANQRSDESHKGMT